MHKATQEVYNAMLQKDPNQPELHQAVKVFLNSIDSVVADEPRIVYHKVLDRLIEPERTIIFRIPWIDDNGKLQINRGFRIQQNSSLGPYKGGLRFHPSVNLSILRFLAFEQVFKNSLTGLPMGGGKGGADFNPKGKSDNEIMKFCQSFMTELAKHIGSNTDVPAGDMGVGSREIGYLFGQYKRIQNEVTGVLTGKGVSFGGSLIRPEATGYGLIYMAQAVLKGEGDTLEGKKCLVSGTGNVAQFTVQKILQLGGKVLTMSDSNGVIIDEEGIDEDKLAYMMNLKNVKRGRISEYITRYPSAKYIARSGAEEYNELWNVKADCAFPCATQNEINEIDAQHIVKNGVKLVCEGANMPTNIEGQQIFKKAGILYVPGKAANAGGVAVSGLEMSQNSERLSWTKENVDEKLQQIMETIYNNISEAADTYSTHNNFTDGANIAGFLKVADAMIAQGYV
ncbi:MAG: NADP-specific glutamate dehydrogenase [Sphaerochaetaceae bacterium]|nr:NADP-specific glutamate dehydrogenase [Sphaerochaetaceae bacterium]